MIALAVSADPFPEIRTGFCVVHKLTSSVHQSDHIISNFGSSNINITLKVYLFQRFLCNNEFTYFLKICKTLFIAFWIFQTVSGFV